MKFNLTADDRSSGERINNSLSTSIKLCSNSIKRMA